MLKSKTYIMAVVFIAVALMTVGTITKAQDSSVMTKEAVQAIIKEYLIENPTVIMEALQAYQENERVAQAQQFQDSLTAMKNQLHNGDAPFAGNPDAGVTIVEFFDYNCGYCKKAVDDVINVLDQDKDVKFVFIDFPILSEASLMASRWALAADMQGKYYEYHVALMEHKGALTQKTLETLAKDVGLDVDKLGKDADSKAVREKIEKNIALARQLGISGTPAFIIEDLLSPGYMGLEGMTAAISQARGG